MATYTRTSSNLIGSPGTPSGIAANGSATGSITAGTSVNLAEITINCRVTISSSAPTTNPTVQFNYSLDGTNYYADLGPYLVPIATVSTSYDYEYTAPVEAYSAQVVVTNGANNSITTYAQGVALGVS